MTLYPRRDVVYVAVSPAEGGCGASHTRPVTHGAPDLNWELNCPQCERHLINDPHWSGTRHAVPETPDETSKRESLVKQKDRSLEEITALALERISREGTLSRPKETVQPLLCKSGHANLPSSRYCAECGMVLADDAPVITQTDSQNTWEQAPTKKTGDSSPPPDFSRMSVSELRRIAEERGIDAAQSKKSLIQSLSS